MLIGLRDQFGGMHQEDLKRLLGDVQERSRQIIAAVVVWIIHTNKPHAVRASPQFEGLVHQHAYPQALKCRHHFGHIMVAQDANNTLPGVHAGQEALHVRVDVVTRTGHRKTVVASEYTQVYYQVAEPVGHAFGQTGEAVYMQIGEMQNPEAVEGFREGVKLEATVLEHRAKGITLAARTETQQPYAGSYQPLN